MIDTAMVAPDLFERFADANLNEAVSRGATKLEHEHDVRVAKVAAEHGMVGALRLLIEARAAEIHRHVEQGYALALALRTQESGIKGDGNVWGHDPTIFIGGHDAKHHHDYGDELTERAVRAYLIQRGPEGKGGMQGAGPLQLTYYTFQDRAMKLGGLWLPRYVYQVGYEDLVHLITVCRGDVDLALAIYNGGAVHPNHEYAREVRAHQAFWHKELT